MIEVLERDLARVRRWSPAPPPGYALRRAAITVKDYKPSFYDSLDSTARPSAEVIVPMMLDLVPARSIVDVGCGDASWLSVFRSLGVEEVLGVDGDWVNEDQLKIDRRCFLRADLDRALTLDRRFDLVMSVEVAEHLPPERDEGFVSDLCALGDVVLFSAAIPGQGGVNHVNEQWPEHWARLFAARGFEAVDCLRPRIWDLPEVTWWYKQNLLVYCSEEALHRHDGLAAAKEVAPPGARAVVHPACYLKVLEEGRPTVKKLLKLGRDAVRNSLR